MRPVGITSDLMEGFELPGLMFLFFREGIVMLRNRALKVQMVRTNKDGEEGTGIGNLDLEKIGDVAIDVVTHTAVAVVACIGVVFAFKTVSQIAINVTNPRNWR